MASIDIKGTRLECLEDGSGDPLVLVHGSASDYRTWDCQRRAFSERFRTLAYSRRYHWPNEPICDGADYSMVEHVDDLQALLGALDAAPAHLVGHSYGASHIVHEDDAPAYNAAVLSFLVRHGGAA